MQLVLEGSKTIEAPTGEEIAKALPAARFARIDTEPDSKSYIQFGRSRKRGIRLEYQVASLHKHYRALDPALTIDRVVTAFQKYAAGDESWQLDFQWEKLEVITIHGQEILAYFPSVKKLGDHTAEP
jgi:hypothetical protein